MNKNGFDYVKPELLDFNLPQSVQGAAPSCYVDCTADDVCPTSADQI